MKIARPLSCGHMALRKGRHSLHGQIYLVTASTHDRNPVFAGFSCACAAARCFDDPVILRDSRMLCWVLMPDHAHWLIELGDDDALPGLVNRLKSASARKANRARHKTGALWAPAFHDHALRAEDDLYATVIYTVNNPVRAGLVNSPGDYPFWNSVWL
ncbi:MAG: transposase [bacterium]|nr:transposase [bacterium]